MNSKHTPGQWHMACGAITAEPYLMADEGRLTVSEAVHEHNTLLADNERLRAALEVIGAMALSSAQAFPNAAGHGDMLAIAETTRLVLAVAP